MTATTTGTAVSASTRDWRSRAACLGSDPELFFPVAEIGPAHDAQVAAAKAVCAQCPVVAECLTDALAGIHHGIAGGLTEGERRNLSRTASADVGAEQGTSSVTRGTGGGGARSRSRVNAVLTEGRRGREPRVVENAEFTAFGRRVLRAAGRRVAAGDVDALPALAALAAELDAAIAEAVRGLRGAGYSWGEIATRLGVTRQAAHQRWASMVDRGTASATAGVA